MGITYKQVRWLRAIDGVPREAMRYDPIALQSDMTVAEMIQAEEDLVEHYVLDDDDVVRVKLSPQAMEEIIETLFVKIYNLDQEIHKLKRGRMNELCDESRELARLVEKTLNSGVDLSDIVEQNLDEIFGDSGR